MCDSPWRCRPKKRPSDRPCPGGGGGGSGGGGGGGEEAAGGGEEVAGTRLRLLQLHDGARRGFRLRPGPAPVHDWPARKGRDADRCACSCFAPVAERLEGALDWELSARPLAGSYHLGLATPIQRPHKKGWARATLGESVGVPYKSGVLVEETWGSLSKGMGKPLPCTCLQVDAPGNKRKGENGCRAQPTAPGSGDPYQAAWVFIQIAPRPPSAPLHLQISHRGLSCVLHSHVLVPRIY